MCVGLSPFIILLSHILPASPAPDSREWSVCERWNSEPHLQAAPLLLRPSTVPRGSWLVCCLVAWAVFWGSWIPGQPLEVASLFAAGFHVAEPGRFPGECSLLWSLGVFLSFPGQGFQLPHLLKLVMGYLRDYRKTLRPSSWGEGRTSSIGCMRIQTVPPRFLYFENVAGCCLGWGLGHVLVNCHRKVFDWLVDLLCLTHLLAHT